MIFYGSKRRLHSVFGLGAALLLHVLLLLAIGGSGPNRRPPPVPDARMTMVMIVQSPPAPPQPAAVQLAPPMPARKAREAKPKHAAPQAITAAPAPAAALRQAQQPAVPQAPIDVDAAVKSAGRLQLEDGRPVAQVRKRQAARMTSDEKLGQDIDKATRSDCRTAHAGKGLFALPFLARDALTERGCKW
jgi:hypothetical protein